MPLRTIIAPAALLYAACVVATLIIVALGA